jgi:hypothetical protein
MESTKTSIIASAVQQDRQPDYDTEARIFSICAKAGVACLGVQYGFGIAPDFVLFQPVVTTLAVPVSTFKNPDEAIAAIKAKLATMPDAYDLCKMILESNDVIEGPIRRKALEILQDWHEMTRANLAQAGAK